MATQIICDTCGATIPATPIVLMFPGTRDVLVPDGPDNAVLRFIGTVRDANPKHACSPSCARQALAGYEVQWNAAGQPSESQRILLRQRQGHEKGVPLGANIVADTHWRIRIADVKKAADRAIEVSEMLTRQFSGKSSEAVPRGTDSPE